MGNSSGRSMMVNTINYSTAQIMGDIERPKETDTSNSRRLCRLLLTIIAIMGLMAIMIFSLLNQPPKRYRRVWLKKEDLHNPTGFLDHMALQLNSIEWQCPCKATDVIAAPKGGARLVEVFLIDANHTENVIQVNSIEQFCHEISSSQYFKGFNATCHKILREGFQLSGWEIKMGNSNLYMNSLKTASLNPIAFMFDVCTSWAGALSQATSFFLISNMGMNNESARQLNTFLQAIKITLETCSKHTTWPPPDNAVYLAEAKKKSGSYDYINPNSSEKNRPEYVVAMSFNWTHYIKVCAPSYCEHLETNSPIWVLFAALAQVGGFVSVTLFALRSVIWPLFCMIFGWPTSFGTCQVKEEDSRTAEVMRMVTF